MQVGCCFSPGIEYNIVAYTIIHNSGEDQPMPQASLIIHGGAGQIPPDGFAEREEGLRQACTVAWEMLHANGTALDAVEASVRVMEDLPCFDAGHGSYANQFGEVEMDAIIMDGATLDLGAVAAVKGIRHPITLARLVMTHTPHTLMVATGAEMLARHYGLEILSTEELLVGDQREYYQRIQADGLPEIAHMFQEAAQEAHKVAIGGNTVGAVARDSQGNIAAATSTGGMKGKLPGRVGDTPLVGSGAYVDNEAGGASSTGHGEMIMRMALAKMAVDAMAHLSAQEAAEQVIGQMEKRIGGKGGIILVDGGGHVGFAFNTLCMAVAWVDRQGHIQAQIAESSQG